MILSTPSPGNHQRGTLDITAFLVPNLSTSVDKSLIYNFKNNLMRRKEGTLWFLFFSSSKPIAAEGILQNGLSTAICSPAPDTKCL